MTSPYYALIVPVSGGSPSHPIAPGGGGGGQPEHPIYMPPGIWPGPGQPTHPIAPGGPPPGYWGGGGVGNYPDAGFPGPQPGQPGQVTPPIYYPPYPSTGPGFPTNPIAPGGGGSPSHPIYYPPYPTTGPGFPTNPIAPGGPPPVAGQGPGFPTNPIAPGGPPPGTWGGGNQPFPTPPIVIPPEEWPEQPPGPDEMVIVVYVPYLGYKVLVVPNPTHKPDQELPPDAQPKA